MAIADHTGRPLAELWSLAGRVAVVTGGARGLGAACAARLAEAGAQVLIGDLDPDTTAPLPNGAVAVELDVTDAGSIATLADTAVDRFGRLDIWVNNAGIFPSGPVLEMSDDEWDRVLDVNLRGTFIGAREAARRMVAAGHGGVIVNLASIAGYRGSGPGVPHYVASKHAVRGLTRQLALEFAPHGIRVVAVAPTRIRTPGVDAALAGRLATTEFEQTLIGPLGRAAVPDDVARVVVFAAGDAAAMISGSTIVVDGAEIA